MKKFTLLATVALTMAAGTANAELMDKYFYKISTETAEGWTLQDAGRMTLTPGKDYLSVFLNNNGGRMINRFWNEEAWTKVTDLSTLPNSTYSFTKDMKMTANSTRTDMEFVLLPVNACSPTDSRVSSHNYHWFNAQDANPESETVEDYFFRYRVVTSSAEEVKIVINENPTARGEWPAVTETSDTTFLKVNVKYTFRVDVNVATKTATYSIVAEDESLNHTGSHEYKCAEDRAGIWVMSANSANSTVQLSNMGLCYQAEGPFANEPTPELFWVEGAERDYMVTFGEGEVLHWIQLGDAEDYVSGNTYENGEEYQVTYSEAMDTRDFTEGEDKGRKIITCNASGDLKMWTSMEDDDTNVSDDVILAVECTEIKLPTPVATITNVSEGFAKEYTITVDNSSVLLKPTVTIHYKMGSEEGDLSSGDKINFVAAGSVELYAWDQTHLVECYGRSETITIENNVEYTVAEEQSFQMDYAAINAGKEGFHIAEIVDAGGKSHWDRIMSSETRGYKEDGSNEVYSADNAATYEWVKEGHNIFADTDCGTENAKWNVLVADDPRKIALPLIPNEEDPESYKVLNDKTDYAWAIFPYEGVVYYDVNTTADNGVCAVRSNYLNMELDPKYISDDETKPNFFIVGLTGGYNRPDKGDCSSSQVLVAGEVFKLYRYDTAIRNVKVMTYKGFTAGIESLSVPAEKAEYVFSINGTRAEKANGLCIVNGKVVFVK